MAVNNGDVKPSIEGSSRISCINCDSPDDDGDAPNLPTEDFLASIGLQPRYASNNRPQPIHRSSTMPPGWRRQLVQRKEGKSAGKFDLYIYSPQGQKFRSKSELEAHFKKNNLDFNISDFNFTVRDKGLLDITSNITHGGVEWRNPKRSVQEICVGDGGLVKNLVKRSYVRRKTADDQTTNAGCDSLIKSQSPSFSKLVVRMEFSKPSKQKTKIDNGFDDSNSSLSKVNNSKSPKRKKIVELIPNGKQHKKTGGQKNGLVTHKKASDIEQSSRDNLLVRSPSNLKLTICRPKKDSSAVKKKLKSDFDSAETVIVEKSGANDEHWVPPQSPFNLVEESLYYSSWRLLIASLLLEEGQNNEDRKVLWEFFRVWPTVERTLAATWQQVHKRLQPFGVSEEISKTLVQFSEEYLSKNWQYPRELYGITKYGDDAYRIFCINEWKQVAPDNHKLNEYHRWLWVNHRALGIG